MDPSVPDSPSGVDESGRGSSRSGRAVGISSIVGLVLGGAAMFYVVRRLSNDWDGATAALGDAELAWVGAGVVFAMLAMASIGWGWRHVMVLLGVQVPVGRAVAWYFVGEMGKYLPGGVWPVLGRGELARRGGVPRTRAYASVAMSLVLLYLSALFVAAAFLPFALSGGGFSAWMLFLLALPVGVGLLHHRVLERLLALGERLTKRTIDVEIPQWKDSLVLVVRYVPTWLFVGLATYSLARSLTPDLSFARVMFATVLSWTAGFLAVPVPAGAGIREAVLTATSGLEGGVAAATALVARLVFVVVDVGGAVLAAPVAGRRRAGIRVGPRHPDEDPVVATD